jgi:hypothetical protein
VDRTAAKLNSFDLSLNSGYITLRFDEPVNGTTVLPTEITLQSKNVSAANSYRLTGGSATVGYYRDIVVNMTFADITALKSIEGLANESTTTFMSVASRLAEDAAGNGVAPISQADALPVSRFITDRGVATVETVQFNATSGVLSLLFSEPVDPRSVNLKAAALSSAASASAHTVGIDDAMVMQTGERTFDIQLNKGNLDLVKAAAVCTAVGNGGDCYFYYTSTFATDYGAIAIAPRPIGSALVVSGYTKDSLRPHLSTNGFVRFDLETGKLVMQFNEMMICLRSIPRRSNCRPPRSRRRVPPVFSVSLSARSWW